MDFYEKEERDGVRLSWNCVPRTKLQHQRNVIPLAAMYTPFNNKSRVPVYNANEMFTCRQCRCFLNLYVSILEQESQIWYCQFCQFSNRLPVYEDQGVPASLGEECSTIEYITGRMNRIPPIFFYVVDTCFEVEDIEDAYSSLKESLITSLSLLPEDALVGFVSFGKNVQVHELGSEGVGKNHCFNGAKEYGSEAIQQALGMLPLNLRTHQQSMNSNDGSAGDILGPVASRFLQPVTMVEYQLTRIIETLVPNNFPHSTMKERSLRATGSAINIAAHLLTLILGDRGLTGGQILSFIAGPCTYGPGKIVGEYLKEPLRSHHDIEKAQQALIPSVSIPNTGSTKVDLSHVKQAKTFYAKVTKSLLSLGLSCSFFIGSYDQVGLYEMDEVCYKTGGSVVLTDSFSTSIFKQSLIKFLSRQVDNDNQYLDMAFNGTLECRTTLDLQIQGLIGNATSLPYRKENRYIEPTISKLAVGEGNTNTWKLCSVNPQSTYAIYFDKLDSASLGHSYIQFLFHYQHPSGQLRLRVTTIPIFVIADTDGANLETGFDQEVSTVLLAREAINRLQPSESSKSTFDPADVLKQLDKALIEFCARYAVYIKGNSESFRLLANFALLPQFMYYLRRSAFIQVFNNSPDETSYLRHIFMHEDVESSLIMIQPTLLSFDIEKFGAVDQETGNPITEPEPVLLDSLSLGHDKILLLDTFFHILIFHGSKIAQWKKAGYHNMDGYDHFRSFLEAPKKEAMHLLLERFPLPRFIDCEEGGSQARFLMAKLNPSTSYATNPNHLYGNQLDVLTDDVSLQLFMDHVQKLVIFR